MAELTGLVERFAPADGLPKGMGGLTAVILQTEVIDWERFVNRRQGAINKHGNPRVRHVLAEAGWRMLA